jgi:quercetin dioxygenase-like cupin family protein
VNERVGLRDVLDSVTEYWSQRVVAEANGNLFKVAKGTGATRWHTHDDQDETFLLLDGELTIQTRSGDVELRPGDLFVVPRGLEHRATTDGEGRFLIIGPSVTSNAAGGKPEWSYVDDAR